MSNVPQTLRNFSLFIEGESYLGRVKSIELPKLEVATEAVRMGGFDSELAIDLGLNALECTFTMLSYDKGLFETCLNLNSSATRLSARGALQRSGEAITPVVVTCQGAINMIDFGTWEGGTLSETQFMMNCEFYSLSVGGEDLIVIDILNAKRVINGKDVLAEMRTALGVA